MAGELAALGDELRDQLARPPDVIPRARRGLDARWRRELGGAQRRMVLAGVAAAQLVLPGGLAAAALPAGRAGAQGGQAAVPCSGAGPAELIADG